MSASEALPQPTDGAVAPPGRLPAGRREAVAQPAGIVAPTAIMADPIAASFPRKGWRSWFRIPMVSWRRWPNSWAATQKNRCHRSNDLI
jgi:hypothetical protein